MEDADGDGTYTTVQYILTLISPHLNSRDEESTQDRTRTY